VHCRKTARWLGQSPIWGLSSYFFRDKMIIINDINPLYILIFMTYLPINFMIMVKLILVKAIQPEKSGHHDKDASGQAGGGWKSGARA
jgi:hypothetical protein